MQSRRSKKRLDRIFMAHAVLGFVVGALAFLLPHIFEAVWVRRTLYWTGTRRIAI